MIKYPPKQEFVIMQKRLTEAGLQDFPDAYGQNLNKNYHFGHYH